MKVMNYVLPGIVLVLVGGWVVYQRQSISSFEGATASLKKQVASARSAGAEHQPSDTPPAIPASGVKIHEPLDWKKVADQLAAATQTRDGRAMDLLNQRLTSMSKDELVAALSEVSALDLPKKSREMLDYWLIGLLVGNDLELGLTCYADRLKDDTGGMIRGLCSALQTWAEKDSAKAIAWFDQQITAGKFDSKAVAGESGNLIEAEAGLIRTLFCSDPAAAARRMDGIPEDQRTQILDASSLQLLSAESQSAYATLVRSHAQDKDQATLIARQITSLISNGSYDSVTRYMDQIAATPAERIACIEEAAKCGIQKLSLRTKITHEDFDTLREWTTAQAPTSTDSATGKALGHMILNRSQHDFAAAAEWVLLYNPTSGNDDVLTSFLGGVHPKDHKAQAYALAGKISDPKRREEFLRKFQ
jgi:hypothetical protein